MKKRLSLVVSYDDFLDLKNIHHGAFSPLSGFMDGENYRRVVKDCHLSSGAPWTIPVTLEVPESQIAILKKQSQLNLISPLDHTTVIATVQVIDLFKVNYSKDLKAIYGTDSTLHPGVLKETNRSPYRLGCKLLKFQAPIGALEDEFAPAAVKTNFLKNQWKTIVGFQTRNPIHRAHEHLQRVALEVCDGLFIQPLVGWKKEDDFSKLAVLKSYQVMIKRFYPPGRVLFGTLSTSMRYAGPREAVFHALIRKNFGCTHFIVGRDHAGVGGFYSKYEAQNFTRRFEDLGIHILRLAGPSYCKKCASMTTEKSCQHSGRELVEISGTSIRSFLRKGIRPSENLMRNEVSDVLISLHRQNKLFVGDKK